MEIKDALVRFRQSQGLSQRQLTEKIGIAYQTYQTWEAGTSTPSAKFIVKMAQAFDVTTDYLLGLTDEAHPKKYDEGEVKEAFALRDALNLILKR